MRTAKSAVLLVTICCTMSAALNAQTNNIFQSHDHTRIHKFNTKVFDASEELGNSVDYSLPSPPMDENCRRVLHKAISSPLNSTSWVETLVFISFQMVSKQDEAIVIGSLKPTIKRGLGSLYTCSGMAKSVSEAQGCATNTYLIRKTQQISDLCSEGTALLNELFDRLKHY